MLCIFKLNHHITDALRFSRFPRKLFWKLKWFFSVKITSNIGSIENTGRWLRIFVVFSNFKYQEWQSHQWNKGNVRLSTKIGVFYPFVVKRCNFLLQVKLLLENIIDEGLVTSNCFIIANFATDLFPVIISLMEHKYIKTFSIPWQVCEAFNSALHLLRFIWTLGHYLGTHGCRTLIVRMLKNKQNFRSPKMLRRLVRSSIQNNHLNDKKHKGKYSCIGASIISGQDFLTVLIFPT